jgi:DNA-directed RNA polymerase sigma subunit (sigma70/sigma32)
MTMTEPTTDQLYETYRQQPTPQNLHSVVKSLSPTIDYALASVNASADPVVRSRAELYTAAAIKKYNPEHAAGANLATHVGHQLRQLSRAARQSRSPVRIPDRAQTEAYMLSKARQSFEEEHGREPTALDLADYTGTPLKRIEKIQSYQLSIPSEEAFGGTMNEDQPDFAKDALTYVYHDADHTDRRILEMKTGFSGHPVLEPQEVAQRLRLTPSQLSRRSMRLAKKIQDMEEALNQI